MGNRFDELAKDLARGVSRREALRRLGGGLLGAAVAAVGLGLGKASADGKGKGEACVDCCRAKLGGPPEGGLAFGNCVSDCVHVKGIDWWTAAHIKPQQTPVTLKNPVAAFALPESREVLIVEADGLLIRVPVPD